MSDIIINADIQVPTHVTLKYDVEVPFVTLVTQADWEETDPTKKGFIQHKPELATVATSGNYNDLENLPTIPVVPTNVSSFTNDAGYITKNVDNLTNYTKSSDLAEVATSGDYHDLINLPIIPIQLQSDWNQINTLAKDYIKNKPTVLSAFLNDTGFINNTVNNLVNYPLSSSLATVATSGSYDDLSNKPEIPSIEGLASETFVGNAISEHNTSNDSHSDIRTSIATINSKIPEQASSSNQLADKNFVNSSVATNTAYFLATLDIIEDLHLTYDATMLQVVAALNDYEFTSVKTNNDYCNVITQDNIGNILFERFKYNSQEETFKYEFALNNSSFTAVQWAAINSNATAENIAQIAQNVLAISALQSAVAGKMSKSGDTMTGDLTFDTITKGIIIKSNDGTKAFRIASTGTYFSIDLIQDYDTDSPRYARVFGFPTNSLIAEMANGLYLGSRTADNKAAKISDIDNKLANYLPLAGGELSGDLKIGENIVEFYSNGYYHRILSDSGSLRIQRSTNRTSWSGVATLYGASSNIIGFGEMRAQATTLTTNDTLTRRAHIYKQGIVSQTQTWTQASDSSYSYVMSNQVTGNIPISFIDKWNLLGSKYASSAYSHTFNESTGYFELNGLTDISYEEAMIIVEESQPFSMTGVVTKYARTNFAVQSTGVAITRFAQSSNIEVAYLAGASLNGTNQTTNFYNSNYLHTILAMRSQYLVTSYTFTNCPSLVTIDCYGSSAYSFKCNVIISGNNVLSIDSLATMVRQRSDTNAFTITVDPAVYQRCQSDTTEYTYSGNTYTGIIAYATARNISIAST